MKRIVGTDLGSYSFNHSTGQITLSGLPAITLEQVVLVTNVTAGVLLYSFASASKGATLSGSVLTLETSTLAMSDTDRLQIIVDLPDSAFADGMRQSIEQMTYYLSAILEKMPRLDSADRASVTINDAGATVALATTQDLRNLTGYLAQLGATGRTADLIPYHVSNAGLPIIYDRITVS